VFERDFGIPSDYPLIHSNHFSDHSIRDDRLKILADDIAGLRVLLHKTENRTKINI
jgi:hypothetical protein